MNGLDPIPVDLGWGDTPLTLRQAEAVALAQWGQSVYRLARQETARRRALAGEVWFDFDPEGDCPVCGWSLVYAPEDVGRPGPDHATCGSVARHRWLVYHRRTRLGKSEPSRMRLLKEANTGA